MVGSLSGPHENRTDPKRKMRQAQTGPGRHSKHMGLQAKFNANNKEIINQACSFAKRSDPFPRGRKREGFSTMDPDGTQAQVSEMDGIFYHFVLI